MMERDAFFRHMAWGFCVESISPHAQIRTCEFAFVVRCGHACGETRVVVFVGAVALHMWDNV